MTMEDTLFEEVHRLRDEVERLRGVLSEIRKGIAATARYDHSACVVALGEIERLVSESE